MAITLEDLERQQDADEGLQRWFEELTDTINRIQRQHHQSHECLERHWRYFQQCVGAACRTEMDPIKVKMAWRLDDFCFDRPWMGYIPCEDDVKRVDRMVNRYVRAEGHLHHLVLESWRRWKTEAELR